MELKLVQKKSKLQNIICNEHIDIKILEKLINSTLLKDDFNNPFCSYKFNNEREQLIKYAKLINSNIAKVKYIRKNTYGRVFPESSLGLFSIRREIRHTLAKNNYIDVDIINCHPVILNELCRIHNIDNPELTYYINNRDNVLKGQMKHYNITKDQAKTLFIRLLYGGTFKSWAKDNNLLDAKPSSYLKGLSQEFKQIYNKILAENLELIDYVKTKKTYNILGSAMSYYLQEIENNILESVYFYCKDNGYIKNNNVVLCADGLMIDKNYYNDELLLQLDNLILDTYGLNIKFIKKEMNQDYLKILDDNINTTNYKTLDELLKTDEDLLKERDELLKKK